MKIILKTLTVLAVSLFSVTAYSDTFFNRESLEETELSVAEREKMAMNAACARPDIDCELCKEIKGQNIQTSIEETENNNFTINRPIRTDEIDCLTQLIDLDFNLNVPPPATIAEDILRDIRDAVCSFITAQSRQIIGSAGLNYRQQFEGVIEIPGTNRTVRIDAGGVRNRSGTGGSSGNSPVEADIDVQIPSTPPASNQGPPANNQPQSQQPQINTPAPASPPDQSNPFDVRNLF